MGKLIWRLKPSEETVTLFLEQMNGAKYFRWLPLRSCFSYTEDMALDILSESVEGAMLGVYSTAIRRHSWPRVETESNHYWTTLDKFEQLESNPPPYVIRLLPGLILLESDEHMLRLAIEERLPRPRYGGESIEVVKALITDLKVALAREGISLRIDDGSVRMVNGCLAIIMAEIDLDKYHS